MFEIEPTFYTIAGFPTIVKTKNCTVFENSLLLFLNNKKSKWEVVNHPDSRKEHLALFAAEQITALNFLKDKGIINPGIALDSWKKIWEDLSKDFFKS